MVGAGQGTGLYVSMSGRSDGNGGGVRGGGDVRVSGPPGRPGSRTPPRRAAPSISQDHVLELMLCKALCWKQPFCNMGSTPTQEWIQECWARQSRSYASCGKM